MQAEPVPAPETKAAETTGDVAGAFEDFMRTFEAFKAENDSRLAEIEQKRAADVLTGEKVDRINRALDEQKRLVDSLVLKTRRPQLGRDGQPLSANTIEHKAAFDAYMRGGAEEALRAIEKKALSVASDGGYLVPDETEREIGRRLSTALADPRHCRRAPGLRLDLQEALRHRRRRHRLGGRDRRSRPQTTAPTLAELEFPTMELYAMPAATATLLDDWPSISTSGWPARSRPSSPSRKAPPSSPATATRSRPASSPIRRSPRRAGPGRRSATSPPASTAPGRRPRPPTSWSISSMRSRPAIARTAPG